MEPISIDFKMLSMFNSILSFSSHQPPINKGTILTLKIWLLVIRKISQFLKIFKKRKVNKMLHSIQLESIGIDALLYTRASTISADGKLCLLKAILKEGEKVHEISANQSISTDYLIKLINIFLSIQLCKTICVYNVGNICSDPRIRTPWLMNVWKRWPSVFSFLECSN